MEIHQKVAEKIGVQGNAIKEIVINKLVEVEVTRRADILTKALAKHEVLTKEFNKINKPDVLHYNEAGEKVAVTSESRFKSIESTKRNISELEIAIDNAVEKNENSHWDNLSKKIQAGGSPQKEEAAAPAN